MAELHIPSPGKSPAPARQSGGGARGPLHGGHALVALLAICVLLLGWRAAESAGQVAQVPQTEALPPVADRALLGTHDPFHVAMAEDALPVTSLPFSLHGVRSDLPTGRGAAIIATGSGEQQLFLVGDTLADGVRLAAIAADHVVLERAGIRETLWLDLGGGEVSRHDPGATAPLEIPDDPDVPPPTDVPSPPPPSDVPPPEAPDA
jgi:general secretion pathway protein C